MKQKTAINDPRAKRWGTAAKVAVLLAVCFFIAPYIWIAVGGLIGLIAAILIVGASWLSRQWVYSVAANARLKLIKSEASKNPVETLQEDLRLKMVALDTRRTNIEKLNGQIRTFGDKVNEIKERYGAQDNGYVKLSADLGELKRIYAHRCGKWTEAKRQLDRFAEEIERANMIWEAAQAAAAARETSGLTEDEFFAKLRTETAFDAIQNGYNEALASLDTAMLDDPATAATKPTA